MHLR
jgi:hypothetical protein